MMLITKVRGARNRSALNNPHKINMERFAYDIFNSVFIRLGNTEFPESEHSVNFYKDPMILNWVSMQVLSFQLLLRDKWKEIFSTLINKYSFRKIDHFIKAVDLALNETDEYRGELTLRVKILFSVHIELFLFLQSQKKRTNFAELLRAWYKIYTRDISRTFKDDISVLSVVGNNIKRLNIIDMCLHYFLNKYFIPYGVKKDCSCIYKLFWELHPINSLDLITATFEEIDDFVTGPKGAEFIVKQLKLPVHERLGIPPHELLIKAAFESFEPSEVPGTDSSVLSRKRRPHLLKLYKRPYSRYQEWKLSKGPSKSSTDV